MLPRLFSFLLPLLAAWVVVPAAAVELEALSPGMTRQDADDYLTKDYTYRVLEDGSVRRVWLPDANSRLLLDFDPKKGTLLSMVLEYRKAVDDETGMAALRTLTGKEKISWAKMPEDKKEKIGMSGARVVKVGKGFAFYESASNGKCRRITIYPHAPKENRLLLRELAVDEAGGSAFENSSAVTDSRKLMEEESKIFYTPNKAELAKAAAAARKRAEAAGEEADTSIAVNTVKAEDPVVETPEDPVADTVDETPEKTVAATPKKKKKKAKEKSFLEKMGLTEDNLMMYGGGLLVLLIIVVVVVRSKTNNDIRKNREKSIRLGTATSADMLGGPKRGRTGRR